MTKPHFNKTPDQARALLVEALRSGKYKQVTKRLGCEDGFCCLGVACELYIEHEGTPPTFRAKDTVGSFSGACYVYDGQWMLLPDCVREWLGFSATDGKLHARSRRGTSSLVGENDHGGTFEEIAGMIEGGKVALAGGDPA